MTEDRVFFSGGGCPMPHHMVQKVFNCYLVAPWHLTFNQAGKYFLSEFKFLIFYEVHYRGFCEHFRDTSNSVVVKS